MSRISKVILSLLSLLIAVLAVLFIAGHFFFDQRFYPHSQIGTVDVSGMSRAEALSAVEEKLLHTPVSISENKQELGQFTLDQVAQINHPEAIVENSFNQQEDSFWLTHLLQDNNQFNLDSDALHFDDHALLEQLQALGIDNDERQASTDATIRYSEGEGHLIQEESQGNQIDLDQVKAQLAQSGQVQLEQSYIPPQITADDESLNQKLEQINQIAQTHYSLEIEDEELTIPEERIRPWIKLDDQQNIYLDQEQIYDYLGEVNVDYATYAKERSLQSTYSGQVTVLPDKMGWWINREVESARIAEELLQAEDVKRQPEISGSHYGYGLSFGDDYIEVDMRVQKMMVYMDNQLVLETDVVTGRPGSETIPGAKYVWDKQSPSVLRGFNVHTQQSYASPVSYWLPIDDHAIGIHDADWQSSFGGDRYLAHGSLGCINTPPDVMGQVFDLAYVGMPVAVF